MTKIAAAVLALLGFASQELFAQRGGGSSTGPGFIIQSAGSTPGSCTYPRLFFNTTASGTYLGCTTSGTYAAIGSGGSMVYPGAGIPNSNGAAWGTSYTTSGSGTVLPTTTNPVFVGPTLGAALATSINGVILTTSTGTFTLAAAKTFTVNNTLTFTGTDSSSVAFGAGGTVLYSGGALGTPSSATLTSATGLPISTGVSGLGTGAATALGVNVGSAGAFITNGGALGTPSSGTLTSATGLPLSTGVTGTLQAAQEPAHTGDVTNTAGSLATTLATQNSMALCTAAPTTGGLLASGTPYFLSANLNTCGILNITPTVGGLTFTLPTTNIGARQVLSVNNTSTFTYNMYGVQIPPTSGLTLQYNGSVWTTYSSSSQLGVFNSDGVTYTSMTTAYNACVAAAYKTCWIWTGPNEPALNSIPWTNGGNETQFTDLNLLAGFLTICNGSPCSAATSGLTLTVPKNSKIVGPNGGGVTIVAGNNWTAPANCTITGATFSSGLATFTSAGCFLAYNTNGPDIVYEIIGVVSSGATNTIGYNLQGPKHACVEQFGSTSSSLICEMASSPGTYTSGGVAQFDPVLVQVGSTANGPANNSVYSARSILEGVTLDCNAVANSIGILITNVQEEAMVSKVDVQNCATALIVYGPGSQNVAIRDFYAHGCTPANKSTCPVNPSSISPVHISNVPSFRGLNGLTVDNVNTGSTPAIAAIGTPGISCSANVATFTPTASVAADANHIAVGNYFFYNPGTAVFGGTYQIASVTGSPATSWTANVPTGIQSGGACPAASGGGGTIQILPPTCVYMGTNADSLTGSSNASNFKVDSANMEHCGDGIFITNASSNGDFIHIHAASTGDSYNLLHVGSTAKQVNVMGSQATVVNANVLDDALSLTLTTNNLGICTFGTAGVGCMPGLQTANTFTAAQTFTGVTFGATNAAKWNGRSQINSSANGTINLQNNAGTGFTTLGFGAASASFPAATVVTQTNPILQFPDGAGTFTAQVAVKHLDGLGTAPTMGTCGTSPSISANSTDLGGVITAGSGTVTSCVMNFNQTYTTAPVCTISSTTSLAAVTVTPATGTLTIGATSLTSAVISYICIGQKGG